MSPLQKQDAPLLEIPSVYGTIAIHDPLIRDLIVCAPFQRLKEIHQYGVVHLVMPTEAYSRFDHSLGVYHLLNKMGVSREEQVAGLLHDVSHTVFSHVGDYVFFNHSNGGSYQDDIHLWHLKESGIEAILLEHGFTSEQVYHRNPEFVALDQPLPYLCADRLEYNLQGGLLRGLLQKDQFDAIVAEIRYAEGKWILPNSELAEKLGHCSLIMTETLWGSAWEALVYRYAADALKRAFAIDLVSFQEFHFSTDTIVWAKLKGSEDPHIRSCVAKMENIQQQFTLVAPGQEDLLLKLKFRGVNPWVLAADGPQLLTEHNKMYSAQYQSVNRTMLAGWPIKFSSKIEQKNES